MGTAEPITPEAHGGGWVDLEQGCYELSRDRTRVSATNKIWGNSRIDAI